MSDKSFLQYAGLYMYTGVLKKSVKKAQCRAFTLSVKIFYENM